MFGISFELGQYIAQRKGKVEQSTKEGGAYGFSGERKVRRALANARPVTMAIEGTARRWKSNAKQLLLAKAKRVSAEHFPDVLTAAKQAAQALSVAMPTIYTRTDTESSAQTLGTDEDFVLLFAESYLCELEADELAAAIGRELGHVQNAHLQFVTALYYLRHDAAFFVRWIVKPAVFALQAWARRADITCDRAGLICSRSVTATVSAIAKADSAERDFDAPEYLQAIVSGGDHDSIRARPRLAVRTRALVAFAESRYFKRLCGEDDPSAPNADDVDSKVTELLGVFG